MTKATGYGSKVGVPFKIHLVDFHIWLYLLHYFTTCTNYVALGLNHNFLNIHAFFQKKKVGPANKPYKLPEIVLRLLRALVPNMVKGQIKSTAHPVNLKDFCRAVVEK